MNKQYILACVSVSVPVSMCTCICVCLDACLCVYPAVSTQHTEQLFGLNLCANSNFAWFHYVIYPLKGCAPILVAAISAWLSWHIKKPNIFQHCRIINHKNAYLHIPTLPSTFDRLSLWEIRPFSLWNFSYRDLLGLGHRIYYCRSIRGRQAPWSLNIWCFATRQVVPIDA